MLNLLMVISAGAVGLVLLLHFISPKKQASTLPDLPQLKVQQKIQQVKKKKDVGFTPTHVENMMRELEEDRDIY